MKITVHPAAALTAGQFVTGTSVGTSRKTGRVRFTSTWSGVYVGIEASDHTGEPMHVFRDGEMNGIPQGTFAFPVNQVA